MTGPLYDLLVVLHVLSALVGFGSVGVTGLYGARANSAPEPRKDARLLRYFRAGTNWPERSLLLTPVFGAVALFAGDRSAVSQPWPWIGLGCWVIAAGVASARCWPAERRIQAYLCAGSGPEQDGEDALASFQIACRTLERGVLVVSVCFLLAVIVMIGQPT